MTGFWAVAFMLLLHFHSGEALELAEYQERKNLLMAEKKTFEEKLSDFERKGNHWLELMRNWIIEANQAGNLIKQENLSGMKDFLVDIGSNRRVAAGILLAEFKTPWNFLAETNAEGRSPEATSSANQIRWTVPGSNRLPHPCHGCALPSELTALRSITIAKNQRREKHH